MYTIEIHNLHLRAGASQSRDSASQSRDEIPTFTCRFFCTIPRLYPTAHHYKTSRLSLATVDRPPLLSVFIIKHHKSFNSARLSVAIMSYDSPLQDFHNSPSHRQLFARLPVAMVSCNGESMIFVKTALFEH